MGETSATAKQIADSEIAGAVAERFKRFDGHKNLFILALMYHT
jgi:hypothetical protein